MPLEFNRSDPLTFGIELELMVLNTHNYDLARGAADILHVDAGAGNDNLYVSATAAALTGGELRSNVRTCWRHCAEGTHVQPGLWFSALGGM